MRRAIRQFVGRSEHTAARLGERGRPELSTAREQRYTDHDYVVDGRTTYHTDANGNVSKVSARIDPGAIADRPRRLEGQQSTVGNQGLDVDEGGHLIANSLGGAGEKINLFPQNWELNRGQGSNWKGMEAQWANLAKEGKTVDVTMNVKYVDPVKPNRPTMIEVEFKIDGVIQTVKEFENVS